ncbi:MAG: hypothetical protein KDC00_03865, partial [Flavobacteriales bacterium]|nr:hypothetical protein [Flavobacteriales bacterium]
MNDTVLVGPITTTSTGCVGDWSYRARWIVTGLTTNDLICDATDLGTITNCGVVLGNPGNASNICGTNTGEPDPWGGTNDQGVWFKFSTEDIAYSSVTINGINDPLGFGDGLGIQLAVYGSSDNSCSGSLSLLGESYTISPLNETLTINGLSTFSTYYVLVDGQNTIGPPSVDGYFGLEIIPSSDGPTNDLICDALDLGALPFGGSIGSNTFNNLCAGTEPGEPNPTAFGIEQTVWFTFTTGASVGTEVEINVTNDPLNTGDQIDLQVALYTSSNGTCTGIFNEVGSDYFTPPLDESFVVDCLEPNTTYWVQVDGSSLNTEGYFGLSIVDNGILPSPNDFVCNAIDLGILATTNTLGADTFNNFCAGVASGEPVPSGWNSGPLLQTTWFHFTTADTIDAGTHISVVSDPLNVGDDLDAKVAVYTSSNGSCTGLLSEVASDYDPDFPLFYTGEDIANICLQPNTTYWVQVDGSTVNVDGFFGISITGNDVPFPHNDLICEAFDLGTLHYGDTLTGGPYTNNCSTISSGEPLPSNYEGTVWFTFLTGDTVDAQALVQAVDLPADPVNLHLALYTTSDGTCGGSLIEGGFADDPLAFSASLTGCLQPNTRHWLQVAGRSNLSQPANAQGAFGLSITNSGLTNQGNDLVCDALYLGELAMGDSVGGVQFHNFCSTVSEGDSVGEFQFTNRTVWFRFSTPASFSAGIGILCESDPLGLGDGLDAAVALFSSSDTSCTGTLTRIPLGQPNLINRRRAFCLEPLTSYWVMVTGGPPVLGLDVGYFGLRIYADSVPVKWYADQDGDGLLDLATDSSTCTQPLGYFQPPVLLPVEQYEDLCPYVPGTVGTPCDDGIFVTVNDTIGPACECVGVVTDSVVVAAKVFLEGPYDSGTGLMNDPLRSLPEFPLVEPYTGMGYTHFGGGGGESIDPAVLAVTGPNAIVDWVVLELRIDLIVSLTVATRSALLQRDGDVVDLDGVSPVTFLNSSSAYYVAIRHRNHLGGMTMSGLSLGTTATTVDFTDPLTATYGTEARKTISGAFPAEVLWSGDVTFDGEIKYTGSG